MMNFCRECLQNLSGYQNICSKCSIDIPCCSYICIQLHQLRGMCQPIKDLIFEDIHINPLMINATETKVLFLTLQNNDTLFCIICGNLNNIMKLRNGIVCIECRNNCVEHNELIDEVDLHCYEVIEEIQYSNQ